MHLTRSSTQHSKDKEVNSVGKITTYDYGSIVICYHRILSCAPCDIILFSFLNQFFHPVPSYLFLLHLFLLLIAFSSNRLDDENKLGDLRVTSRAEAGTSSAP